MVPSPPTHLRAALGAAGPRPGAVLVAREASVSLADLARGTSLGPARLGLAGRSVLLATETQLAAALAMVDLDGLVGRLVVCPPDLKPEHRASVIEADAESRRSSPIGILSISPTSACPWSRVGARSSR